MNGSLSMMELLLGCELSREERKIAKTSQSCGESLLSILDFSKIEAGKLNFKIIPFDLHIAVEDTVSILTERAQSKDLELALLIEHSVPAALCGDPGRVKQILLNLLANAIKFTEKGEVVLRVKLLEEVDTRARVKFLVTDTGIGISQESISRLFQSFTQADGHLQEIG